MTEEDGSNLRDVFGIAHPMVLLGLVLLMVLAGGIYLGLASRSQQPQPGSQSPSSTFTASVGQTDPTSGWKEYEVEKLGYQVCMNYPPNFSLRVWDVSDAPPRIHYVSFVPENYIGRPQPPEIGLVMYENFEMLPLTTWLERHTDGQSGETSNDIIFDEVVDLTPVSISGTKGLDFVDVSPVWGIRVPTVLFGKGRVIFRLFHSSTYTEEDLSQTFGLILDTLVITP